MILIGIILMQVRGQGGGLFGASDGSFRTRRGIERTLFQATIILSIFFIVILLKNYIIFHTSIFQQFCLY